MDETTGRFDLLKAELAELQQGIRAFDQSIFQVKGWAVTVGLASAGLALSSNIASPAVLGVLSAVAFLGIDSHLKMRQRRLIKRNLNVEAVLNAHSIHQVLNDPGLLQVPALGSQFVHREGYGSKTRELWRQLRRPSTFAIYLGLTIVLTWVAIAT